jgi:cytochrome c-type biogenesis protein CcmH
MLWVIIGALAIVAGAALALPMLRVRSAGLSRAAYDSQVYRDQLAELDHDVARDELTAAEAETARTEIVRRLLAADQAAQEEAPAGGGRTAPAEITGIAVALAIPAGALALYAMVGSPTLPGRPALEVRAEQAAAGANTGTRRMGTNPTAAQETAAALLARLAKTLESRPDDLRGWSLYANALSTAGRFKESITAYQRVIALAPKDAAFRSRYGEALAFAAGGTMLPIARQAMLDAITLDPNESRARYYIGLADYQAGRTDAALRQWLTLEAEAPPDAPWRKTLAARIAKFAKERGVGSEKLAKMLAEIRDKTGIAAPPPTKPLSKPPTDPVGQAQTADRTPPPMRGPTADDVKAAQKMSSGDRQAMIRGMVDGLAEKVKQNPGDVAGWLRLARSYGVLKEPGKLRDAYAKAAALKPADADILSRYAEAIAQTADPEKDMPAELATVSDKLLALQPDHGAALWFSGIARAQSGDTKGARERWTRLLSLVDPASPQHVNVKARLDALPPPK